MRKFRIGLIGLGGMAQAHIRWMHEEKCYEIVAISDVNEAALAQVGEQLGISAEKRYPDYRSLIVDQDVEAVVSVTPNNVHAEIVDACLKASKPFLAEKPFTRELEEAIPLLELYKQQPVPAMFCFSYRYTPAFRYARELVRANKIGAVRSFAIQYLQAGGSVLYDTPYIWRFNKEITGTGTLGDLGSHMIDLARFLFDSEFEELSAQLHTIVPQRFDPASGKMARVEVDDFASFQARMSGEIMGVFQTTRNAVGSGNQHEVSIYGDFGTIHASTLNPDQLILIHEVEKGQLARVELEVPARCKVTQYADFQTVLEGAPSDSTAGFMDAYHNQVVLDAIVRASATKTVVQL